MADFQRLRLGADGGWGKQITPSLAPALTPRVSTSFSHLGTYKDLYLHSLDGEADGMEKGVYGETKEGMRKAIMIHALNHVFK